MKKDFTIIAAELFGASGVEVPGDWNPLDDIRVWKGQDEHWHVEPGDDHTMAPRSDEDAQELWKESRPRWSLEVRRDEDWEFLADVSCEEIASYLIQADVCVHLSGSAPMICWRLTALPNAGPDEALYWYEGRWCDPSEVPSDEGERA